VPGTFRFEVAVITVDWLVLLVNGSLLAGYFRRGNCAGTPVTSEESLPG
jgi:hypothetical protein